MIAACGTNVLLFNINKVSRPVQHGLQQYGLARLTRNDFWLQPTEVTDVVTQFALDIRCVAFNPYGNGIAAGSEYVSSILSFRFILIVLPLSLCHFLLCSARARSGWCRWWIGRP